MLTVRRADPSDAHQLSHIVEATFRGTFGSVNTAEDMDLYCRNCFGEEVQKGETQRLYVADQWHGKGVAQGLMRACTEEETRRGSDAIWLGVWEHNPRAIAFYRKWGFVAVGDQPSPLGRDLQRDLAMVKTMSSKANGA